MLQTSTDRIEIYLCQIESNKQTKLLFQIKKRLTVASHQWI